MAHETIPIQGRIDIKSFAALARAYATEHVPFRTKSDILWMAVEQLAAMYMQKHETGQFETMADALEFLDSVGVPLGTNYRTRQNVAQSLAAESFYQETGQDVTFRPVTVRPPRQKAGKPQEPSLREKAEAIAMQLRQEGKIPAAVVSGDDPNARAEALAQRDADFQAQQKAAILMMKGGKEDGDSY